MSNPKYKKETNILSVGEEVVIGITNPKLNVTVSQETPDKLILKCADSVQEIPCTSVKGEGPWSIEVDCLSANSRFAAYDGVVQLDVYESQLACVGPVTTSIGLII